MSRWKGSKNVAADVAAYQTSQIVRPSGWMRIKSPACWDTRAVLSVLSIADMLFAALAPAGKMKGLTVKGG